MDQESNSLEWTAELATKWEHRLLGGKYLSFVIRKGKGPVGESHHGGRKSNAGSFSQATVVCKS